MTRLNNSSKPYGNINLSYTACQTLKDDFRGMGYPRGNHGINGEIVQETLKRLWEQRKNSEYYGYASKDEKKLAEILGFDVEDAEKHPFGYKSQYRKQRIKMATYQDEKFPCEPLIIPDVTDFVRPGILTDEIGRLERELIARGDILTHGWNNWKAIVKNHPERGFDIPSLEKLRERFIDNILYIIFIAGYCLPKIDDGTRAEEHIRNNNSWIKP